VEYSGGVFRAFRWSIQGTQSIQGIHLKATKPLLAGCAPGNCATGACKTNCGNADTNTSVAKWVAARVATIAL
jgi:hypothetical protein